jgi:hypothetical protein
VLSVPVFSTESREAAECKVKKQPSSVVRLEPLPSAVHLLSSRTAAIVFQFVLRRASTLPQLPTLCPPSLASSSRVLVFCDFCLSECRRGNGRAHGTILTLLEDDNAHRSCLLL